jgi:hypothetical protein
MGGWRDGGVGFAFYLLKAIYITQIACRLRELEQQQASTSLRTPSQQRPNSLHKAQ